MRNYCYILEMLISNLNFVQICDYRNININDEDTMRTG